MTSYGGLGSGESCRATRKLFRTPNPYPELIDVLRQTYGHFAQRGNRADGLNERIPKLLRRRDEGKSVSYCTGKQCRVGQVALHAIHFGHRFTTDVRLIRFRADADESVRITLPDLLRTATCRLLGIEVAEVMATYSTMYGNMIVILYDRTPGGAGFVKTIGKEFSIAKLLDTALRRIH
jgi:hypothetical protein